MSFAITAITVATVSTVASVHQSREARKDQKKAAAVAEKQRRLETSRNAIDQIRQSQIARASILQQGENQGAVSSTAIAGATGAVQSQTGGNIGFANRIFELQNSRQRLLTSASTHQGRASGFGQLANLAMLAPTSTGSPSGADGSGTVMNDNFKGIGS